MLHRIEALADHGSYAVGFLLADGREHIVVMRVVNGAVHLPAANLLDDWAPGSASFDAVVAAIRAVDEARALAGPRRAQLADVPGGWDVTLGNITLSGAGHPTCVAHGGLEVAEGTRYVCPACGAAALFGDASV